MQAGALGVMATYPSIDGIPAHASSWLLTDILRGELGFKGLVVTDDLEMKAITDNYSLSEVAAKSLAAGVDLFLVCHSLDKQVEVLEALLKEAEKGYPKHLIERSSNRIREHKKRHFRVVRTIDRGHARELVGNREHQRIARRLKEGK